MSAPIEELAAAIRRSLRGSYPICGACFGPLGELEGRYDFTKCDACQTKEHELHDRAQRFGLYAYHASGGDWRLSWLEPDAPYPDCCVDFLSGPATRIAAFLDTLEGKDRAP
jgi:hypothetical protein